VAAGFQRYDQQALSNVFSSYRRGAVAVFFENRLPALGETSFAVFNIVKRDNNISLFTDLASGSDLGFDPEGELTNPSQVH